MIWVTGVAYSKEKDVVVIKYLFPFNYDIKYDVKISDDIELKQFLVNIINERCNT